MGKSGQGHFIQFSENSSDSKSCQLLSSFGVDSLNHDSQFLRGTVA